MRKIFVLGLLLSAVAGVGLATTTPPHCASITDCATWGSTNCSAPQVAVCAQPNTAQSHCTCYTPPPPATPGPPKQVPGMTCWEIFNDCTISCPSGDDQCQNSCGVAFNNCAG